MVGVCLQAINKPGMPLQIPRGALTDIKPIDSCKWPTKGMLPNFCCFRIIDATYLQVKPLFANCVYEYTFFIGAVTSRRRAMTMTIPPVLVSKFGAARGIQPEHASHIVKAWGARMIDRTATQMVLDLPDAVDIRRFREDMHDKHRHTICANRFSLNSLLMDMSIAAGGWAEITLAFLRSNVVDLETV